MRIRELKLIRYGKFTERQIELPYCLQDIHFIVGPNEAGKSTVRSAITDLLFGVPERTPMSFLHPNSEIRLGGILESVGSLEQAEQVFCFERIKGRKNTLKSPADVALPDNAMQPWIGNLEAPAFNRLFALDHAALLEGGEGMLSAQDDLGRLLFQSAAGIQHLGNSLRQLQEEADSLWGPKESMKRAYYQAKKYYDVANSSLKQATLHTKAWSTQHEALKNAEEKLEESRKSDSKLRKKINRLERIRRVGPLLRRIDRAQQERALLLANGDVPLLGIDAANIYQRSLRELAVAKSNINRLKTDIDKLESEIEKTPVDTAVLAESSEIKQLDERRLQLSAYPEDIDKRRKEITDLLQRANGLTRDLGWTTDSESSIVQRLPAAVVRSRLRTALKHRVAIWMDLEAAKSDLNECKQSLERAENELDALTGVAANPNLAAAIEEAQRVGDFESIMIERDQELAKFEEKIENGIKTLGQWSQPITELRSMATPDLTLIQGLIDNLREEKTNEKIQQDALLEITHEILGLEQEFQHIDRRFSRISREQVVEARRQRDDVWHNLRDAPQEVVVRARELEGHISVADTLADSRHGNPPTRSVV